MMMIRIISSAAFKRKSTSSSSSNSNSRQPFSNLCTFVTYSAVTAVCLRLPLLALSFSPAATSTSARSTTFTIQRAGILRSVRTSSSASASTSSFYELLLPILMKVGHFILNECIWFVFIIVPDAEILFERNMLEDVYKDCT